MNVGEAGASSSPGVAVGHAHGAPFLQRLNIPELPEVLQDIQQRRFAGARVSEYVLHPFSEEHLGQGMFPRHYRHL